MLTFGDIKLDVPFFQAPLSGYTDMPMRVLGKQFGAPLTFTGVLLDKIALHPKAVRKLKFQPHPDEHPVGAQILGSNPETMAGAAAGFERIGYDLVDINLACPAPKVLRRGRGGAMLKDPKGCIEIFRQVRAAVKCPITIKLRIGYDSSAESLDNFWQVCEKTAEMGVDGLVIHGRTVVGKYRGKADWDIVKAVKERFPDTQIIGSGDIMKAQTAIDRLEQCGLDGILIARGAIGNPWIFSEIKALYLGTQVPDEPTLTEQGQVMLQHFGLIREVYPDSTAVPYFRKFAASYCKRHPQRKKAMLSIMAVRKADEVCNTIRQWYGL